MNRHRLGSRHSNNVEMMLDIISINVRLKRRLTPKLQKGVRPIRQRWEWDNKQIGSSWLTK